MSFANRIKGVFTPKRVRVLKKMAGGVAVSAVPVGIWWKWAIDQRHEREEDVRTRVRVPNVQTIDDLMIERCRPGDVLLFDRRWEHCAAGPLAALVCMLGRYFLCDESDPNKAVREGKFDHCGIVVPGYAKNKSDELDASNLLLLEATAGGGIVARPLLTRLEMSQSRQVLLLPLALPGERRNDQFYEPTDSVIATEKIVRKKLEGFRDSWVELSKSKNYQRAHSTLGLMGCLSYPIGYHSAGPTSPAAWLVTMALADAKVAQTVTERNVKEAKVEDFLRDYRFQDHDVVVLRPGWRFLAPVSFRAT
eukprot:Nitzschia sp. Nitz4//scaffold33_size148984//84051//85038//NITZ4_002933-RA/size148984-snap-gene-0.27-mRNA-1//-1//CDS//3329548442//1561//frame0